MKPRPINPVTATYSILEFPKVAIDRIPFEDLSSELNHGDVEFNYHDFLLDSSPGHSTLLDGLNLSPQQKVGASPLPLIMRIERNKDITPANLGMSKNMKQKTDLVEPNPTVIQNLVRNSHCTSV